MHDDGNPKDASTILESGWLQYGNSNQNNLQHLGSGQNNQNAVVLQR